jgi:hypothetical protein
MLRLSLRRAGGAHARPRRPARDGQGQADQRRSQQQEGPAPQQPGAALHRRAVEHEVAVALHHEVQDLLLTLALLQLLADLFAQVHRQVGMRRGNGLVLADQAAQFFGDAHDLGFEHRILGQGLRFLGCQWAGQAEQQQRQPPQPRH